MNNRLRFVPMPGWRAIQSAALLALLAFPLGCGDSRDSPGGAEKGPLLSPFAGDWAFDIDSTLGAMKAAGAEEQDLECLRLLYEKNPQFPRMHADMSITGSQAVCSGTPSAEYRFFAMHEHDGRICGKAWHHEDRFDPGDMNKCYVRVAIKDERLHLEVRMQDGFPDLSDPDLRAEPPAEDGSPESCDADSPAGAWSAWTTYVFARER